MYLDEVDELRELFWERCDEAVDASEQDTPQLCQLFRSRSLTCETECERRARKARVTKMTRTDDLLRDWMQKGLVRDAVRFRRRFEPIESAQCPQEGLNTSERPEDLRRPCQRRSAGSRKRFARVITWGLLSISESSETKNADWTSCAAYIQRRKFT